MATTIQRLDGVYTLDRNHSTFQFAVRHLTIATFRASFADIDARLIAEEGELALEAHALAESVSISAPDFREHVVRGADFFEADAHPAITFRSTCVELADDGSAIVAGELTVRGVTQPVTAYGKHEQPTEDPYGNTRVGLELRAIVDRRNWEMNWQAPLPDGGDALGWDVELSAQLELIRA